MKKLAFVVVSEVRAKADACAVKAFRGKQPFFVRYDIEVGEGLSGKSLGIVRTPQRELIFTTLEHYL